MYCSAHPHMNLRHIK